MIEAVMEYSELLVAAGLLLSGIIGKLLSDQGKKSLVKELDEAKSATVKAAQAAAPVLDLAYNIGTGKIPLDATNLKKLKDGAATTWTDTLNLSKEVKDVLDQFAVEKGVTKP